MELTTEKLLLFIWPSLLLLSSYAPLDVASSLYNVQQRKLPIIAATSGASCFFVVHVVQHVGASRQVATAAAAATPSNIRIDPDFFIL